MKVLIVDESSVSYGNMSILIERMGIEVLGNATTEKEIEKTIIHHNPDLVLIDTRCSYLHGADTIRRIKNLNPETNVIAVSVFESHKEVKQVFASGISDIITKPVESERLIQSLERLGMIAGAPASKKTKMEVVTEDLDEVRVKVQEQEHVMEQQQDDEITEEKIEKMLDELTEILEGQETKDSIAS